METEDQYEESVQGEGPEKDEDSSYVSSEYQSQDEDSSLEESKAEIEEDEKSEEEIEQESVSAPSKKAPKSKIIFNITDSHYPVTKLVGKKVFGWRLSTNPADDWDICWIDKTVPTETLAKMRPYQKINHFPGILSIARKNNLGKNLMKMKKSFPDTFNFFPKTYLLPTDYQEFKNQFIKAKKPKTFIIKPEASAQGRGIFLTKTWEGISPKDRYVAQKYLKNPYLIDGLKFDLRLYVLLAGCDPLRIFLYQDGLGRFATEKYCAPTGENMNDTCMHLTNYAINKENPNFIFNNSSAADDVGHKKSLKAVFKILEDAGHDTKPLWEEIKKIIVKTFCSVQPILAHNYKSCHPNEPKNNMCFEILGFDIMLDSKLKPWLIEVNHLPSFTTDTPLDKTMKKNVIKDALQIMNISSKDKAAFKEKKKLELQQRAFSSRKVRLTPEEKQAAIDAAQKERDEWEDKNLGGYEKIFPLPEAETTEDFEEYIRVANQNYRIWTGTDVKNTRVSVKRDMSQDVKEIKETVSMTTDESPLFKTPVSTPYKKPNLSLVSPRWCQDMAVLVQREIPQLKHLAVC